MQRCTKYGSCALPDEEMGRGKVEELTILFNNNNNNNKRWTFPN